MVIASLRSGKRLVFDAFLVLALESRKRPDVRWSFDLSLGLDRLNTASRLLVSLYAKLNKPCDQLSVVDSTLLP